MDEETNQTRWNTSLQGLKPELLLMVIDLLPRADIAQLRLVNSYMNGIARSACFKHLELNLYREIEDIKPRWQNLEAAELLPTVQSLRVKNLGRRLIDYASFEKEPDDGSKHWKNTMGLLSRYLLQMTALTNVNLQGVSFSKKVLEAIPKAANVGIVVERSEESTPILRTLQSFQNLHALDLRYTYATAKSCRFVLNPLRDVFVTCPNLRVLKLDIAWSPRGSTHSIPTEYHGIGLRNGEKLAALRSSKSSIIHSVNRHGAPPVGINEH